MTPHYQPTASWRETFDPFALNFHAFHLKEVLDYPHAGNDVFHVRGLYQGHEITPYIKVARQPGAAIENEVSILQQLSLPMVPRVIDSDFCAPPFSITTDLPGLRLSAIVGDNHDLASLSYMEEYGEALAHIHNFQPKAPAVADRSFFHIPPEETLNKLNLFYLKDFFANKPKDCATVFCHGDFHYANLLWKDHHISGILDFELSGYGNRDFDIAWALILRPGQKFLKTEAERQRFLDGYSKHGQYHADHILYYMAQIYVHFLRFCQDDQEYCNYVMQWLKDHCASAKY